MAMSLDFCNDMLTEVRCGGRDLIPQYEPESKCQSLQWKHGRSAPAEKKGRSKQCGQNHITTFFHQHGHYSLSSIQKAPQLTQPGIKRH